MSTKEIVIGDVHQKYSNPIAELVQTACQFRSSLLLIKDNHEINAKSIMGIMAFNPSAGMEIELKVEGPDAEEAMSAMEDFLLCR